MKFNEKQREEWAKVRDAWKGASFTGKISLAFILTMVYLFVFIIILVHLPFLLISNTWNWLEWNVIWEIKYKIRRWKENHE